MSTCQTKLKLEQILRAEQQKRASKPKPESPPPFSKDSSGSFDAPAFWAQVGYRPSTAQSRKAEQAQSMRDVKRWLNYEDEPDKNEEPKKKGFVKKVVKFFGGGGGA
jgi:hypothetical protein